MAASSGTAPMDTVSAVPVAVNPIDTPRFVNAQGFAPIDKEKDDTTLDQMKDETILDLNKEEATVDPKEEDSNLKLKKDETLSNPADELEKGEQVEDIQKEDKV